VQRAAGNAAVATVLGPDPGSGDALPAGALVLPPYLLGLETAGPAPVTGVTGHERVVDSVAEVVGHRDGAVAGLGADLAGRPESFFGAGRTVTVRGGDGGRTWFDVTVGIVPGPGDAPPLFAPKAALDAFASSSGALPSAPAAALEDFTAGKDTKVDVQHTSVATSGTATGSAASHLGVGGTALVLAPVAPALWLGVGVNGAVRPFRSARESRTQRTVGEPRVLRGDSGSVDVRREVRYRVEVRAVGGAVRSFEHDGELTQHVSTEHLVAPGTEAPGHLAPLTPPAARRVALADSLAPLGVAEPAPDGPRPGGGGLFDAVAAVLHPSVTAPGAPGRERLLAATSAPAVLADLPRLLGDGVLGEDLRAKDGTAGSYRMRGDLTALAPAGDFGRTQLRTHQQTQHTAVSAAARGRAVAAGVGPAIGVGASGSAAVVRATAMPVAAARKERLTRYEQTVTARQGAEVRGRKALYEGTVRLTVEGTGPRSPGALLDPRRRVAEHTLKVWVSLRADEAADLGLPLPPGTPAGDFVAKPPGVERHLAYPRGSSVILSRLDARPLLAAVTEAFAADPRLAGYLPDFGVTTSATVPTAREAALRRDNHRALHAALSATNLRTNKAQLLAAGIPIRLRRKTARHSHDVLVRVTGTLGDPRYLGDTEEWMVRAHSGVTSGAQSGRSSARSAGVLALAQARLVPGLLSGTVRYEKRATGTRHNQAGPTTRTDNLVNGSDRAAVFGADLLLSVDITLTSRPRKRTRTVTPGRPGREAPEPELIAGLPGLVRQPVRLLTPAEFTLDDAGARRQREAAAARGPRDTRRDGRFAPGGIGELATLPRRAITGETLPEWLLTESVGDGEELRRLAFDLLARAAARGGTARPDGGPDSRSAGGTDAREDRAGKDARRARKPNGPGAREDRALETEGLAPRLAIEERLGPQAVHAALRQAAGPGWVVKDLRHPRRLAGLTGAVGTRVTLANPVLLHKAAGPGTETLALGGHQAAGQRGRSTATTWQGGPSLTEDVGAGRTGQGFSASRTGAKSRATAAALSGTVERNAHTPKKAPLHLVVCDLVADMVAEVKVTGRGPYVASGSVTVPGGAAVWLTEAQLPRSIRRQLGTAPVPAVPAAPAPAAGSAAPSFARGLPLGFGMLEELPDFTPLARNLRGRLAIDGRQALAERLLPARQSDDPNDNVQRLLRVLDRTGSAALLSSAMDGGVTVELFDGRATPYWAVFTVARAGDAAFAGLADDKRDLELITSATAQRADTVGGSRTVGVTGAAIGSVRPDGGADAVSRTGGVLGAGLDSGSAWTSGTADRGQIGVKTVAETASARVARMRLPLRATLRLYKGERPLASAESTNLTVTYRALEKDLAALRELTPPAPAPAAPAPDARHADPGELRRWRAAGVQLPMEAQVNGFQGAPHVRELVNGAVRAAGGGARFHRRGQSAAYTLTEAVSTEWLIAALPLLTSAGVELPPVHATGVAGEDLDASVHARLRAARVLGTSEKMTFETVGRSSPDVPRPAQTDGFGSAGHAAGTGRAGGGAGVLGAGDFRLDQLTANEVLAGAENGLSGNAAGSWPLHKPKTTSVLVQFTVDVRVVATVTRRAPGRTRTTAVRDLTLPHPVVLRLPHRSPRP
jgi:hypothetical protein